MIVKTNKHTEKIARLLFGIESVPKTEVYRMKQRVVKYVWLEISILEAENKKLRSAIKIACQEHRNVGWGWDGDCGSDRIMEILEDELEEIK